MKIYLDEVILLNFFFDFILLVSLAIILKRNINIKNIVFASIVGSTSIFILFLNTSKIVSILIKIIISILMVYNAFGIKSIFKNTIYLYSLSIFLGGFLYMINNMFGDSIGLIFINKGISINIIFILLITPILLKIYIKNLKELKNNYNNYYNLDIFIKGHIVKSISYLDTGNKLVSPYSNRPILLLHNKDPIFENIKYSLVPYNTVSGNGIMKCYKVDKLIINNKLTRYNFLVGLIDNINIDGVDSILNVDILEGT